MKRIIDYLVNDLGVSPDTAASITITLLTFVLGIIGTLIISYVLHELKRGVYRRCLRVVIKDFFSIVSNQIKVREKALKSRFVDGDPVAKLFVSNHGLTYLLGVDKREFIANFGSIWNKKRAKVLSRLFQVVESIKIAEETYLITMDRIEFRYEKQETLYQENLDNFRKLIDSFAVIAENRELESHPQKTYIEKFDSIFMRWCEAGMDTRIKATNDQLAKPILEMSREHRPAGGFAQQAIEYGLLCERAIANIETLNEAMQDKIRETIHFYKRAHLLGKIIKRELGIR